MIPWKVPLGLAAALALWTGLAQSAGAQGLNLGLHLGGINIGVGVGTSAASPSPGSASGSGGNGGASISLGKLLSLDAGTNSTGTSTLTQQAVSEAVKSKKALPLDMILGRARLMTDGDIIDARLVTLRGFLLYDIKVLGETGDVSDLYFYARSGEQVQTN